MRVGLEVSTGAKEYLYNGKEFNDDFGLDMLDYGVRWYDPSIARWHSVDPAAELMPGWAPYNYTFNNPIMFIDPDGAIPYPITIRAFAPFKSFGGGFHGDNRGYSTGSGESARVHQRIDFDTDRTDISTTAWSSPTSHAIAPGFQRTAPGGVEFTKDGTYSDNGTSRTFEFGTHVAGSNPLTPGAPPIDVFSEFSITENKEAGTLNISGALTGDNFPSTEAFVSDPSGQNVFIAAGFYEGSPLTSLWGENKDNSVAKFNLTLTTDADGNFTGVQVGDNSYSIDEWNKLFETADPHKNNK